MSKKCRKKSACAVVVMAVMLCISGCGSGKIKSDKVLRVGVVTYTQDDPFINALADKLKENLKSMETEDMKITVSVKNGNDDKQDQNDTVEEMIDAGCDVLCVNLVDRTAPSRIIRQAKQNNIPVIFFNREPVWEDLMQWDQLYYVGAEAKQSGQMQGQLAAAYIKEHPDVDRNHDGKIQYVILEGEMGHQDAIIRTESVAESLKEQGIALEKLSYQIANWNRVQAQNRMMQLIGQYNNRMEVVLANNDAMALGAMDAYEKLGYTETNRPVFFGIDGTKEGLEAVKDGTLAATVYNDKEGQAAAMANLAFSIATEDENNPNSFKNYKYIYRAYQKVTKENVQTFLEKEE